MLIYVLGSMGIWACAMVVNDTPFDLITRSKSKCIRCDALVPSNRDFCSKECEEAFFKDRAVKENKAA